MIHLIRNGKEVPFVFIPASESKEILKNNKVTPVINTTMLNLDDTSKHRSLLNTNIPKKGSFIDLHI